MPITILDHTPKVGSKSLGPRSKGTTLRCSCGVTIAETNEGPPSRTKSWQRQAFVAHVEKVDPRSDINRLFDKNARIAELYRTGDWSDEDREATHAGQAAVLGTYEVQYPRDYAAVVAYRASKHNDAVQEAEVALEIARAALRAMAADVERLASFPLAHRLTGLTWVCGELGNAADLVARDVDTIEKKSR